MPGDCARMPSADDEQRVGESAATCPGDGPPMPCWLTTHPLDQIWYGTKVAFGMGPDKVLRYRASMSVGGTAKDEVAALSPTLC